MSLVKRIHVNKVTKGDLYVFGGSKWEYGCEYDELRLCLNVEHRTIMRRSTMITERIAITWFIVTQRKWIKQQIKTFEYEYDSVIDDVFRLQSVPK